MNAEDLALVEGWLHEPHVGPWWVPSELDDITRAVRGDEPVDPWLLVLDGDDVGYFQVYDVGYDAEYRAACASIGVEAGTAGMDYLLGDPALKTFAVNRGTLSETYIYHRKSGGTVVFAHLRDGRVDRVEYQTEAP